MKRVSVRYSEAFKRQVVDQIARGKYATVEAARRAYGIGGSMTVGRWVRRYGSEELQPKRIRIETMNEIDELKAAKRRIRELEAALADAHIKNLVGDTFLEVACERLGETPEEFKKNTS